MRRIFWSCVILAVAAAGSVYLASRPVEREPLTVVGKALVKLGGEESAETSGPDAGGLPVEPMPVGEEAAAPLEEPMLPVDPGAAPKVVVSGDLSNPGEIVIEEPETMEGVVPVVPATEPEASVPPLAAPKMPYCNDETGETGVRMPYAEEDEHAQEEEHLQRETLWELLRKIAVEAKDAKCKDESTEAPELPAGELPEPCEEPYDYHHHHHEMTCPASGQFYPKCRPSPAIPEFKEESKKPEMSSEKAGGFDEEEQEATPYHLDTMEFRPSDAGFFTWLPGQV